MQARIGVPLAVKVRRFHNGRRVRVFVLVNCEATSSDPSGKSQADGLAVFRNDRPAILTERRIHLAWRCAQRGGGQARRQNRCPCRVAVSLMTEAWSFSP
jgi:hypothetical protein